MSTTRVPRRDRRTSWLLTAPALALTGILLVGGLGFSLALSFGIVPGPRPSTPGIGAYGDLLDDVAFQAGLKLTLRTALLATALSSVVGIALALALRAVANRATAGSQAIARFMRAVLDLVLAVPHVIAAVAILFLLSPSGVLSRWIPGDGFPFLTQDSAGIGIMAELVWKESVFIALIVLVALDRQISDLESDAASLGAGRWRRLRDVTLPRLMPTVLVAAAVSFAYAVGTVEVPQLLGSSFPTSLSRVSYDLFRSPDLTDRPAALAVAVLTGTLALLGAGLLLLAARLSAARLRRGA